VELAGSVNRIPRVVKGKFKAREGIFSTQPDRSNKIVLKKYFCLFPVENNS